MIRVVSLFCGIGGSDLGLYLAADELGIDVEVVAAFDSWNKAVEVYNQNQRHPVARVANVKQMTRADLPPHDLIIGGPPCQPFSMAGKRLGHADPRNCLPDFLRLVGFGEPDESPYIMENVAPRLINAPFSTKLCAADFGDVTSRKRWFYSNYLLHIVERPGPRRIRDIRDHAEDERVIAKRLTTKGPTNKKDGRGKGNIAGDDDFMASMTSGNGASSGFNRITCNKELIGIAVRSGMDMVPLTDDDLMPSLVRQTHRNYTKEGMERATLKLKLGTREVTERSAKHGIRQIATDTDLFPSLTAHMPNDSMKDARSLKLGLRGNSATATAFEDDAVLGSILANSFHANEESRLVGCRNPSLLEMQRAHSFPDSWEWLKTTKTDRGKMISNSWPVGMATAVCKAMLMGLVEGRKCE